MKNTLVLYHLGLCAFCRNGNLENHVILQARRFHIFKLRKMPDYDLAGRNLVLNLSPVDGRDSKFLVFCCLQTTLDMHYWQIFAKVWSEGYDFDIFKGFVLQKMPQIQKISRL
jgi:hypothetical protein